LGPTGRREKGYRGGDRAKAPYGDLYVYLINGLVREDDEVGFGDAFIGNWVEEDSSFLFFSSPGWEVVSRLLESRPDLELADDYYFAYEDWQGGGLDPLRIENFLIIPPWAKVDSAHGEIPILLDPGVVFGNGLHPTTRDCVRALSYAARETSLERVLDLGTGTGVLALAAAFLGAKKVFAVDLNPLCVKTALRNVRLNKLDEVIRVVKGRAEDVVDEVADTVVANIHHEVIQGLLERRIFREKERIIISGLMRSQARGIKYELDRNGFRVMKEWDHEMTWYTILAIKS
jgi:ribosomal protein L11 methyltransferase